jgi:hypothetical protein
LRSSARARTARSLIVQSERPTPELVTLARTQEGRSAPLVRELTAAVRELH